MRFDQLHRREFITLLGSACGAETHEGTRQAQGVCRLRARNVNAALRISAARAIFRTYDPVLRAHCAVDLSDRGHGLLRGIDLLGKSGGLRLSIGYSLHVCFDRINHRFQEIGRLRHVGQGYASE